MLRSELARRPEPGELAGVLVGPAVRVPGEAQEILERELVALEVADVDDPDAVGAVLLRERQLLPELRDRAGVEPLVAARPPVVVEVIVHARATRTLPLGRGGQAAEVAPVVLGPEQRDIVGHAHAVLIKFLHLLVEAPHLRDLRDVRVHLGAQEVALPVDDLLEQLAVRLRAAGRHLGVVRAAQAERDDALVIFIPPHALAPEVLQHVRMLRVVPAADRLLETPVPLLLRAQHRLLVRGAHDDAVLVGQARILGVVLVEGVVPHRRPEVVGTQAQHHLEEARVELAAVIRHVRDDVGIGLGRDVAEFRPHPIGEVRRLVVQENPAITHRGPLRDAAARLEGERGARRHGHVRPPVPRRHADLLRNFVDAVDRAALVAAGDDEGALDAGQRLLDGLDDEALPFSADGVHVELSRGDEPVDQAAFTHGADEDGHGCRGRRVGFQLRPPAGHARDVGLQVAGRAAHAGPFVRRHDERCDDALRHERHGTRRGGLGEQGAITERSEPGRERGQQEHQEQ